MDATVSNENAFQSYRKVTAAVAEFLGVMSEVAYRTVDIHTTCKTVEGIYKVWFKDIILEVFSDKRVKTKQYHLTSLLQGPEIDVVHKIRISEQCEPLEKMGKVADSKVMMGVLISFEAVNMGIATIDWFNSFKKSKAIFNVDLINASGSLVDLIVAVGDMSKNVGKTPLSVLGTLSAAIDSGLALYESTEEYKDKDYDAMASKIIVGVGSATLAVGSAMVTAAAFSAAASAAGAGASVMAVAHSVLIYGAGMTALGVGSPVGGALIFIGAVAVAAGTIAYFFTNDSKTETWLKQSPWGVDEEWSFETGNVFGEKLDILHGLPYAFKAEVWYDPWKKRAGIRMKSAFFQVETKIVIQEMLLNGDGKTEKVISVPILIDEKIGHPQMEIEVKAGSEIDLISTLPHSTKLQTTDSIEAKLLVDLFGNGKVMLPERNKPVICKSKVYG